MKINIVDSTHAALAPWVIGYVGAEMNSGGGVVRRVIPARPNCFLQVILDGGHAMVDVESGERLDAPVLGLFGPLTHYRYDMEITGRLRTFCVRLQPAAAGKLFGIDPVALVDNFAPIAISDTLLDELRTAETWQAMAVVADRALALRTVDKRADDPVIAAANRLREAYGQISVHVLAESAGLSMRQFQRRFHALTGLNPKHYARICRIGFAVHRKELEPDAAWTTLAAEAGYADQSHFIRDFKALTGRLPGEFLRGQTPILRSPQWEG